MHAFMHINDMRTAGVQSLSSSLIISDSVTIWAPGYFTISKANEFGATAFSPRDIVNLVEAGHLKIAAREDWIVNGEARRRSQARGNPNAQFVNGFDSEILRIFYEDVDQPVGFRRVYEHFPEGGQAYAQRQRDTDSDIFHTALDVWARQEIPKGVRENIQNVIDERSAKGDDEVAKIAAEQIVRHAFNHREAMIMGQCNLAVDVELFWEDVIASIVGPAKAPIFEGTRTFSRRDIMDAIQVGKSLSGKETWKDIIKLREDPQERRFFWEIVDSEVSAKKELYSQVSSGLDGRSYLSELYGSSIDERLTGIAGSVSVAAGLFLENSQTNRRKVLVGLGFLCAIHSPAKAALERSNQIFESDYSGPQWPRVFALGSEARYKEDYELLLRKIENV